MIKEKFETTSNTQVNSVLEIIYQVIPNLVYTFDLKNNYLNEDDPWSDILADMEFALRNTHHIRLQSRWCLDLTSF